MTDAAAWVPRHCLGWLLAAQAALIAPHVWHLPTWVSSAWLLCALWRVQVYRGQWSFPGRFVKIVVVVASLVGIRFSYGRLTGLEPTVALLISGFSLKLVEAATRREAYLLLFLGYFVAVTEFLFDQSLGMVLYMVVPVLLLTTALIALQQDEPLHFSWQPLREAGVMSLQALPLLLLLFLVFPRIAPLWRVPMPHGGAQTGITDHLDPGDIAQLSQSDALAFRAKFDGAIPPRHDLYWRGLVLDVFDGRAWRPDAGGDAPLPAGQLPTPSAKSLAYEIFLEPTYQRWLYALRVPEPTSASTVLTVDYRLRARDIVAEKFAYSARAYPEQQFGLSLSVFRRAQELALPASGNPRARAWARQLRTRYPDDGELIAALLAHFHREPYFYTLRPPPLGRDVIDEFLFDTRRGFCEHYASSFVFVLRAAGIPARIVVGYQGGEINPLTQTVLVHQFDAHAWAEAWLAGRGWVRFDPTAAVAPQRIERGLERAIGADEFLSQAPFSIDRLRSVGWINAVRWRLDAINYAWTRWVVNYRDDTQMNVLSALLGDVSPLRMALLLVGGGAAILAVVGVSLFGRHVFGARLPAEQRYYARFCARLARRGYPRPAAMAPGDYARWVLRQQPQWRLVDDVTACFEALSYRRLSAAQRDALLKKMRRLVRSREMP